MYAPIVIFLVAAMIIGVGEFQTSKKEISPSRELSAQQEETPSGLIECVDHENSVYYLNTSDARYEYFERIATENLGLPRDDYVILRGRCDLSRGGFVEFAARDRAGRRFDFYYHWGWCSSGGAACGYDVCISTPVDEPSHAYDTVREIVRGDFERFGPDDVMLGGPPEVEAYEFESDTRKIFSVIAGIGGRKHYNVNLSRGPAECKRETFFNAKG